MKETAKIYGKEMTYDEAFEVYMKEKIKDKFDEDTKEFVEIANVYLDAIGNESKIEFCTENNLEYIFDNNLHDYFENEDHAEHFDTSEKFLFKKDGWLNTTDDYQEIFKDYDLTDYIYNNQGEFEDYLDFDEMVEDVKDDLKYEFDIEDEDEEEEE